MAGAFKFGLKRMAKEPELKFGTYLLESQLPPIPQTFGRSNLVSNWGMLGNNKIGDCTIAGAMHAVMAWNAMVSRTVMFTTLDAQEDYSAVSGYVPGDGSTDTGADMEEVAAYWRKTGMRDNKGSRHLIGAYMLGNPANLDHLFAGCYLLGPVGLGIEITDQQFDQFDNNEPWHIVPGETVEGYHYVPLIDRATSGNAVVVSWGGQPEIEQAWLNKHLQEVVYYVSSESITNGKSPQGFAMEDLLDDLSYVAT